MLTGLMQKPAGVQGFFQDRDDIRAHGRDERMSVRPFYEPKRPGVRRGKFVSLGPALCSWPAVAARGCTIGL